MSTFELPTVQLFGLPIANTSWENLTQVLEKALAAKAKDPLVIFTPNPEQVIQAQDDSEFAKVLRQADVLVPDGVGLLWASQMLHRGNPRLMLQTRITGVQLAQWLLQATPAQACLLIGGRGYGNPVQVKGKKLEWNAGYRDVAHPSSAEEAEVIARIEGLKPKVVFVAFGAPYQEQWVIKHLPLLKKAGVRVVLVVGGAFDELLGKVAPTPEWIDQLGGKWLHRLVSQPWRWRRQIRLLQFVGLTFGQRFTR